MYPQPHAARSACWLFPGRTDSHRAALIRLTERTSPDEATLETYRVTTAAAARGWSEDDLRRLICSVQVEDATLEGAKPYVEADFKRFILYTLSLVPPEQTGQRILELGANPYFTYDAAEPRKFGTRTCIWRIF